MYSTYEADSILQIEYVTEILPKSCTKNAWELHVAFRTVFENQCSTSNTTPAGYNVTALVIY